MTDITVAIPVYNVAPFVEASLLSVLDQRLYTGTCEVLVIDDCGTDGSMDVVQRVLHEHPNGGWVRIIRHPQNLGLGQARNTAIDEAQGRYLLFLDADDVLLPDSLSHLYELAVEHDADVVAGSTEEVMADGASDAASNKPRRRYSLFDRVIKHEAAGVWMNVQGWEMNIEAWNKLIRLDTIRHYGIRTVHRVMEDSVFDFRLRIHAHTIVTSSRFTLRYTLRPDSILGALQSQGMGDDVFKVYLDIIRQCQRLIAESYHSVSGIYDLYCIRLFYTFYSMRRMRLAPHQRRQLRLLTRQWLRFIPSWHLLESGFARLAVAACMFVGYRWQMFEYIYNHRYLRRYVRLARLMMRL